MQFDGGYRYPAVTVCAALSCLGMGAVAIIWSVATLPILRGIATLLLVEGTVLWASSFTPKGLAPPPSGIRGRLRWFFRQQGGVTFAINQPMFYLGILLVIVGTIVSSCAG
jgi:hypothetical protein